MQSRLLQKLKRQQHADHLQRGRKRDALLGLDHAQQEPRRDHLLVVQRHRYIERRQQQTQKQRKPAQKTQGTGNEGIARTVTGAAHEVGKARGPQKPDGQSVHQQAHAPFGQILGEAVGPLCVQKLREGRARRVRQALFQNARGKQRVEIQGVKPLRQRRHGLRRCGPVKVQHGDPRHRLAANYGFHQLELRRAEPAPHKGGVYPQGLDEGILGALDGLFKRRLRHRALHIGPGFKAHGLIGPVKQQHTAAVRQITDHVIHRLAVLTGTVVHSPGQNAQQALPLALLLRQAHKTRQRPDHIFRQHPGGDQTVDPADGHHTVRLKPEPQRARLKVRAGGEDLL